jgi:hypothetical protein
VRAGGRPDDHNNPKASWVRRLRRKSQFRNLHKQEQVVDRATSDELLGFRSWRRRAPSPTPPPAWTRLRTRMSAPLARTPSRARGRAARLHTRRRLTSMLCSLLDRSPPGTRRAHVGSILHGHIYPMVSPSRREPPRAGGTRHRAGGQWVRVRRGCKLHHGRGEGPTPAVGTQVPT